MDHLWIQVNMSILDYDWQLDTEHFAHMYPGKDPCIFVWRKPFLENIQNLWHILVYNLVVVQWNRMNMSIQRDYLFHGIGYLVHKVMVCKDYQEYNHFLLSGKIDKKISNYIHNKIIII